MNMEFATLVVNAILTPVLVLLTLWAKSGISQKERMTKREDGFIEGLAKRIEDLEKEVREVRVELKNRDAEYLNLYKDYTTLKAKYEVLQVDHTELRKQHDATALELANLKEDIKKKADDAAQAMKSL